MRQRGISTPYKMMTRGFMFFLMLMTCYPLLLSGCGWHLRGSYDFPVTMDKLYIEGAARYSDLGVVLHNAFQGSNTRLTGSPSQAKAILHVISDKTEQRILATDGSGRASEYEISYFLSYTLVDVKGAVLVREQEVKTKREYKFDPTNVLASGGEVDRLKKDMINISVQQMLRRINASLRIKAENVAPN